MRPFVRVGSLLATALLVGLASCGGGGGGGGSTTPTMPGTLSALALEGAAAPSTGAGVFGAFSSANQIDVADGGWTAFVADVTGGTTAKALFVARPDGVVVNVFARGDVVPAPAVGTIDVFERIWISPGIGSGAIVTALVTIIGASAEGILTARVPSGGVATETHTVAYKALPLPVHPAPGAGVATGTLTSFVPNLIQVDDQGNVFFVAGTSTAVEGIWTVSRLGTSLTAISVSGDTGPSGGTISTDYDALGIDGDGLVVAYAVSVLGGPTHAIIATISPLSLGVLVAVNGGIPPLVGGRSFLDVYDTGPLYVTLSGGVSYVVWQAQVSGGAPDRGVFARQVSAGGIYALLPQETMVYPGMAVTGLGVGAFITNIELMNGASDPNRMPIRCDIAGGTSTRALFSAPNTTTLSGVVADGQTIPSPGGTTFSTSFPSLTLTGIKHGDRLGSLAFSSVLADATTGIYWAIAGGSFFQVVRQGATVPSAPGGTFASFAVASPVLTATNFVVFTANITGGTFASGLFRQG